MLLWCSNKFYMNRNKMQCALQQLSIQNQMLTDVLCYWTWTTIAIAITNANPKTHRNQDESSFTIWACYAINRWSNSIIIISKQCYQIYKRTRIFITPRVVEFSMKSNFPESISATHAEDRNHQNRPWRPLKSHVIINLSAVILLRRLLT